MNAIGKPWNLSIVIPVYRAAETLPALVAQLCQALPEIAREYEIILVNDGSPDNSWEVICQLAREFKAVRGIDLMRNYGQHSALLAGIRAARFAVTVTMDDDLQHPPSEIPTLLQPLTAGYDVVYGTPESEQHGLWRDLASQLTKIVLQGAMGADTARRVSAFRALLTPVRDAFQNYHGHYVSIDVLLTWGSNRFTSVSVRHQPRLAGRSNYNFRKLVTHALNMMTGFSTLPLQVASLIGFAFTLLGVLTLVYVIGRYLIQGGSVPGFPFLASTIALFSGAQLFALGIMGEYLARMHYGIMQKPPYVIRSHEDLP